MIKIVIFMLALDNSLVARTYQISDHLDCVKEGYKIIKKISTYTKQTPEKKQGWHMPNGYSIIGFKCEL
jgi:hypothetical protein